MRLSYIVNTRNRRQTVLETLSRLPGVTSLAAEEWETWVIDNASTDGTAEGIGAKFPNVHLIQTRADHGPAGANVALAKYAGKYLVTLTDDALPADGRTIASMLSHLESDEKIGAVVGKLVLPDGTSRGPALPSLVMPGATCLRKSLVQKIGGFATFRGSAADYDLSFRICEAGSRIDRREEILFHGQPAEEADDGPDPVRLVAEIRDQLVMARRYLPDKLREIYWHDWSIRYKAIIRHALGARAAHMAMMTARLQSLRQMFSAPEPIGRAAVEAIFDFRRQTELIGDWARRHSVWRVVLADFSDNIWATYNACRSCGLQMRCIADNHPAFGSVRYRGLPVAHANRAFEGGGIDGVIITNTNPSVTEARFNSLRNHFRGPILKLWEMPRQATQVNAAA